MQAQSQVNKEKDGMTVDERFVFPGTKPHLNPVHVMDGVGEQN
jgi:hypothetical protein